MIHKHICIIEDDQFLGSILSDKLKEAYADVTLLTSGEELFALLTKTMPDMLLLDILLPGIHGLEILEKLRADTQTKTMPVIIVSNTDSEADREKAKSLHAGFMVKAITDPKEILAEVEKVLTANV